MAFPSTASSMTGPHSQPERIDLAQADDPRDVVHRAVACLAQGGIVGLATETDYGLAASALHSAAVIRLCQIQGSDAPSPLTLLLRGPVEVADWVPNLSELGWRLARRPWPGPITLMFPGPVLCGLAHHLPTDVRLLIFPNETVALRVPSHRFIREVLRLLPAPLVLSKAPGPDNSVATTADPLIALEGIDMIVDAGPTQLGGVSTAVRVESDRWSIVRPGVVEASELTRMAGTILLFVCTGNTCRSPMAEALCKMLLAQRIGCTIEELEQHGYVVLSAGMAAAPACPPRQTPSTSSTPEVGHSSTTPAAS